MKNILLLIFILTSCSFRYSEAEKLQAQQQLHDLDLITENEYNHPQTPSNISPHLNDEKMLKSVNLSKNDKITTKELVKRIISLAEKNDLDPIKKGYSEYLKNKNDIKRNRELYDLILAYKKQYHGEASDIVSIGAINSYNKHPEYHKLLKKYYKIKSASDYANHALTTVPTIISLNKTMERLRKILNNFVSKADEIKQYSIAAETKKVGFIKPQSNYTDCDATAAWWDMNVSKKMQKNCIYEINGGLEVMQVLGNGVLLSGSDPESKLGGINLFLYTKKNYTDGERLFNKYIFYVGNYS